MKVLAALVLVGLCLTPAVWVSAQSRALQVVKTHAVEILLDQAQPSMFPRSWLAAPIAAKATKLAEAEQARSRTIVEQALSKYPPKVVSEHLRQVYVVSRLEYFGVATGGTNSRSAVYLANNGRYRSEAMESVFHAEFSSILLREHPRFLNQAAWDKTLPPGFRYRGNGVQAIKRGEAGQTFDESLHEQGFIVEYAMSNQENDFNGIACRLFSGDAAFWSRVEKHPRLKAKTQLVMAFYRQLDPTLNQETFQSFCHP
jgi:hypothetical protein